MACGKGQRRVTGQCNVAASWAAYEARQTPAPDQHSRFGERSDLRYQWAYFVEFTKVGGAPIDLSGWVYDDNSRISFPGESVIITEATEAAFRTNWGLAASVKVIGEYTNNLGRADEINLFDSAAGLADRLTYGDEVFPGSPRTQDFSGNPISPAALGANDATQWQLSFVGDAFGSYTALTGEVGNPGSYIPAPASAALMGLAGLVAGRRKR